MSGYYDHSSVDFQMYGHGGFGYDTSHVPKNEPHTELFNAANNGNLAEVRRIVEAAEAISEEKKNDVLNYARRWTEVDYRASGFTKEHAWFDSTPLAEAASRGHDDVVQYLLEEGADPTLSGCPDDDVYYDAFKAAEIGSPRSRGARVVNKRCNALLDAVKPYWKKAKYAGQHYNQKSREKFTNAPTDREGMLAALRAV